MVIDRQFLAPPDRFAGHIQDVPLANLGDDVRVAAVIDELRPAAADGAVQRPVVVKREQIDQLILAVASPFGLFPADTLAGVLDDLASRGYIFPGVNAPAMNL